MGVDLKDLVHRKEITLEHLSGKTIAIDAYNILYQFLSTIRGTDGSPLVDKMGRATSHLSGLFYRTVNLIEAGIKPVYVFDGAPPALKEVEIKRRKKAKEEATIKYEQALKVGKLEEARVYAQATAILKDYMVHDSKKLLNFMGIPWIQAPSEGEAQAAHLAAKGLVWAAASQDYDSLLFGAPRLVRNLGTTGKRKLPRKPVYIKINPEIVELSDVLNELKITREQLIDLGILIGTDFNPEGVKGIGPRTALKLIQKYGRLENIIPQLKEANFAVEPDRIRQIFLNPSVKDFDKLEWRRPNFDGIISFLCEEHDFSRERVEKSLSRLELTLKNAEGKSGLEKWF